MRGTAWNGRSESEEFQVDVSRDHYLVKELETGWIPDMNENIILMNTEAG